MGFRPIRTDSEYRQTLKDVSALFDNEPEVGTAEGDAFGAVSEQRFQPFSL